VYVSLSTATTRGVAVPASVVCTRSVSVPCSAYVTVGFGRLKSGIFLPLARGGGSSFAASLTDFDLDKRHGRNFVRQDILAAKMLHC